MKRLIVHVGYPKAASTTLQNEFFLDLHKRGQINFLGRAWESKYYGDHPSFSAYKDWLKQIILYANRGEYERAREISLPQLSETMVNVFSEGLLIANENHRSDVIVPRMMQEMFSRAADDIQIMMVIRNQKSLLMSYFVQNYQKLPQKTFKRFMEEGARSNWAGRYKIFHFDRIAGAYAECFGADKIKIVLFETLLDSREAFVNDLASAMGIPPVSDSPLQRGGHLNATSHHSGHRVVKKTNMLTARGLMRKAISYVPYCNSKWLNVRVPDISEVERREIFEVFKESNRRLADRFSVDGEVMRRHGYF